MQSARPAPAAECLMKDKQRPARSRARRRIDLRAAPEHAARNGRRSLPRNARQGKHTQAPAATTYPHKTHAKTEVPGQVLAVKGPLRRCAPLTAPGRREKAT